MIAVIQNFVGGTLFAYFWGFLIIAPVVFIYLFHKGYKLYGYFVVFLWFCYTCRFLLPMLLADFLEEGQLETLLDTTFAFFTSVGILLIFPLAVMIVNFLLQGKFIPAFLMLLLYPAVMVTNLEARFIFYPLMDTTHSPEFTLKKFKSIQPGMTRDEVVALIGNPHPSAGGYFSGANGCEAQTGDNGPMAKSLGLDFAWLDSAVCYDEQGRVTHTEMGYVPD